MVHLAVAVAEPADGPLLTLAEVLLPADMVVAEGLEMV
jgi:hypothetical protein